MKRWIVLTLGLLLISPTACAALPQQISGDAWDYKLKAAELGLPGDWTQGEENLLTADDLAAGSVVTPTASLARARQLYTVTYQPPENSTFGDYTLEIIIFPATAEASAAIQAEALEKEWQRIEGAPTVGDESRVWRFVSPDPTISQGLFRVDVRRLNAILSVTMLGAAGALPDATEPLNQARKVLAKMEAAPEPSPLSRLRAAQTPDLRTLLLTQKQIAAVSAQPGAEWSLNSLLLPGWTDNESFSTPEARQLLQKLGRITGYQMWLINPPAQGAPELSPAAGLFQQVSAYRQAASGATGLKSMVGLKGVTERPDPPLVGEAARAWSALIPRQLVDGTQAAVATTEVDFRVDRYVGSVQLQSQPVTNARSTGVLKENYELAVKLAQALADNLVSAKP